MLWTHITHDFAYVLGKFSICFAYVLGKFACVFAYVLGNRCIFALSYPSIIIMIYRQLLEQLEAWSNEMTENHWYSVGRAK